MGWRPGIGGDQARRPQTYPNIVRPIRAGVVRSVSKHRSQDATTGGASVGTEHRAARFFNVRLCRDDACSNLSKVVRSHRALSAKVVSGTADTLATGVIVRTRLPPEVRFRSPQRGRDHRHDVADRSGAIRNCRWVPSWLRFRRRARPRRPGGHRCRAVRSRADPPPRPGIG